MKILLPIDDSDCAQGTLKWATHFLKNINSSLYLLTVLPFAVTEYDKAQACDLLDDAETFLTNHGLHVEKAEWVKNESVKGICNYADKMDIDQIIMGSHGRQGFAHFLLGSVSEGVFRHAKQPVIVVNNRNEANFKVSHMEDVCLMEPQNTVSGLSIK